MHYKKVISECDNMGSVDTISAPWPAYVASFSIEFSRRHKILCVDIGGHPTLLISAETPAWATDSVRRTLGHPVTPQVLPIDDLVAAIDRAFEYHATIRRRENRAAESDTLLPQFDSVGEIDDLLASEYSTQSVRIVNELLLEAIQRNASDLHLQPFETHLSVRMRIDGVLQEVQQLSLTIAPELVSRLKVAGKMDIAERRLPQDGRATVKVGQRVIDLRLASMPTSFGERVVVRLLDKSARLYRLPELGMSDETLNRFRSLVGSEHGLILVTGPTGSGKSTTLYGALSEVDTRQRNVVTLEDPIEYQLPGVSQTQINQKKGLTFAKGLRSILRQDPDIILVGEIRDTETAVMAVQAAMTGHLVFSTLHTNDAASAVTRLLDLGIEPYLVSSSLLAVLAQRLVRTLCAECLGSMESSEACEACHGTAYRGRTGIYELLVVSDPIREAIQRRQNAAMIRSLAISQGMTLLRDDGRNKVAQGITTDAEIQRVTLRSEL